MTLQVIDTVIDPRYNNFDGTNVDYDMAVHRLASPSTKTPAQLNLGGPPNQCSSNKIESNVGDGTRPRSGVYQRAQCGIAGRGANGRLFGKTLLTWHFFPTKACSSCLFTKRAFRGLLFKSWHTDGDLQRVVLDIQLSAD